MTARPAATARTILHAAILAAPLALALTMAPAAPALAEADPAIAARAATEAHGKAAFIASYDLDGDGRVSFAEFREAREASFHARDANGDGVVDQEEYLAEYEARLRAELEAENDPERFEEQYGPQMDQARGRFRGLSNDDGVITLADFHASGDYMFRALDTNEDGVVDDSDTAAHY